MILHVDSKGINKIRDQNVAFENTKKAVGIIA
jgi:hypothetical protein